jgi:hypothetical protein
LLAALPISRLFFVPVFLMATIVFMFSARVLLPVFLALPAAFAQPFFQNSPQHSSSAAPHHSAASAPAHRPATTPAHPYPATTAHPPPAWFINVAPQAGLTVLNINGNPTSKHYIVEATGSGVAILDYDNDGFPDVFIVNGNYLHPEDGKGQPPPTSRLYHNNHDGTFTDVTRRAGLSDIAWGQGACVGDYDNDGYDDLFVTGYGTNRLYHNNRNGTFSEVAAASGVSGSGRQWGTGCAFVDYDRDGLLDIAVATYVAFDLASTPRPGEGTGCIWKGVPVMCGPRGLPYVPNLLYHNLGHGKFADVSKSSGFEKTNGHYCFSVSTLDYDGDGWPDIYMACDSTPSILYHNNRDGTFTDVAQDVGVAFNEDGREQAGMGSTIGDYDGDLRQDIFKTNFSDDTATLYHADSATSFSDVTAAAGLAKNVQDLGWGALFADVDNDGWLDLIVANSHVYPEVDTSALGSAFREPRIFYRNLGPDVHHNVRFDDLSASSGPGITTPASSRGLAAADLFNDGRVSFIVNNLSDRPMLLVNVDKNENHWLGLHLIGTRSNRDAIGAQVTLHAVSTEDSSATPAPSATPATTQPRQWIQEVRSGSSYNSSSDLRLHFGLGPMSGLAGVYITVRWPSGLTETFGSPSPDSLIKVLDKILTLKEGSGQPSASP